MGDIAVDGRIKVGRNDKRLDVIDWHVAHMEELIQGFGRQT